ncbi:MAG: hypothetical protein OEZ01_08630, partial [Candidatus Heimdallarchaeota archaeon]|nr:hypothetical protein [Candidatus Heimdallarchaeota archaeon]
SISEDEFNCLDCGSSNDTSYEGYIVCTDCGYTKERDYVYYSPIAKSSTEMNNQTHHSIGKKLDFVGSLGSEIGYSSGLLLQYNGKSLSPTMLLKYQRLIKHHNRTKLENNLNHTRTLIAFDKVFKTFNLSNDVKTRTIYKYWKYVNSGEAITNHMLLIALCFILTVKEEKDRAPINIKEIIDRFSEFGHRITKKNVMNLGLNMGIQMNVNVKRPYDYFNRHSSLIKTHINNDLVFDRYRLTIDEFSTFLTIVAGEILKRTEMHEIRNIQPYGFALSIIYMADRSIADYNKCKQILTQRLLTSLAETSKYIIRDHIQDILGKVYNIDQKHILSVITEYYSKLKQ